MKSLPHPGKHTRASRPTRLLRLLGWVAGLLLLLAGCWARPSSPEPLTAPFGPATATPFRPHTPTPIQWPTATPTVTPTPIPPAFWVPQGIPWSLPGWRRVQDPSQAQVRLVVHADQPQGYRVFVVAVPAFHWAPLVTGQDVRDHWEGRPSRLGDARLFLSPETLAWFTAAWGPPAENRVETVPADDLLRYAWGHMPGWTLLPWEALNPSWRVAMPLHTSPLTPAYEPAADPLALPLAWEGENTAAWHEAFPLGNRDPNRLTTVVLTGVTALVRATAYTMEIKGITYPAESLGPLLRQADITHISNEVPFDPHCPPPNPVQKGLKFCSHPRYMALLEAVGTDVVELTGDHFNDRGPEAMRFTLEMYRERGWDYYGGGENLEDARRPVRLEHHGNRIAFLGCNAKGGGYATASPTYPGAQACQWEDMTRQVRELRAEGYLPIVTFQHHELYVFDPPPSFKADFRRMAQAGAIIVSGSQAHHPHGLEIYGPQGETFIQYGLGNLFFDQKGVVPNGDWGFFVWHVFYGGRHLTAYPVPYRFVDFARPELLSWEQAEPLMRQVFAVSRRMEP